ncbi:MAG: hypothetical protein WA814_08680 [Candidatus Baltobacteraceae bacterium]
MKGFSFASAALLLATLGTAPATNGAQQLPGDVRTVLERMSERNPSLESYRARVHVDVRMLNFPFLAPKLDGTSYYRRPDTYVVVFDSVPSYARGFQRLFDDIGNPDAWEKDENISIDGTSLLDGRQTIVLRLTKKIHSDILDHVLAYVDPSTYALDEMQWYYTSGGKITMSQEFRQQGVYSVVAQQRATIDIPHVHAVAEASYGDYQTNLAVDPAASTAP